MRGQPGHRTRPHVRLPPIFLSNDAWMISQLNLALIRKLTWVIGVFGSLFCNLSMGVCITGHWQTSARLVQESNVYTVVFCLLSPFYSSYIRSWVVSKQWGAWPEWLAGETHRPTRTTKSPATFSLAIQKIWTLSRVQWWDTTSSQFLTLPPLVHKMFHCSHNDYVYTVLAVTTSMFIYTLCNNTMSVVVCYTFISFCIWYDCVQYRTVNKHTIYNTMH